MEMQESKILQENTCEDVHSSKKKDDNTHEINKSAKRNKKSRDEGSKVKCIECQFPTTASKYDLQHYRKCKKCGLVCLTFAVSNSHLTKCLPHKDTTNKNAKYQSEKYQTSINNAIFVCPYCGVEFTNKNEWRLHLDSVHEFYNRETLNMEFYDDGAKCKDCDAIFPVNNSSSLEKHRITHLPYSSYIKCKLCGTEFNGHIGLTYHMKTCPNTLYGYNLADRIVICRFCDIVFLNLPEWTEHIKDIHKSKNYISWRQRKPAILTAAKKLPAR